MGAVCATPFDKHRFPSVSQPGRSLWVISVRSSKNASFYSLHREQLSRFEFCSQKTFATVRQGGQTIEMTSAMLIPAAEGDERVNSLFHTHIKWREKAL